MQLSKVPILQLTNQQCSIVSTFKLAIFLSSKLKLRNSFTSLTCNSSLIFLIAIRNSVKFLCSNFQFSNFSTYKLPIIVPFKLRLSKMSIFCILKLSILQLATLHFCNIALRLIYNLKHNLIRILQLETEQCSCLATCKLGNFLSCNLQLSNFVSSIFQYSNIPFLQLTTKQSSYLLTCHLGLFASLILELSMLPSSNLFLVATFVATL